MKFIGSLPPRSRLARPHTYPRSCSTSDCIASLAVMESIELAVNPPSPPPMLHLAEASTSTLHLPTRGLPSRPGSPRQKDDSASIATLTPERHIYDDRDEFRTTKYESSLAPVDGGFAAWSLVRRVV